MQDKKFVIIGFGSVSQCLLPLLIKHCCKPEQVTIIDAIDYTAKLNPYIKRGVKFINTTITKDNYDKILSSLLSAGDCLIELSTFLDTLTIVTWCAEHNVNNINTSINGWDDKNNIKNLNNYHHDMNIYMKSLKGQQTPTIILEHGANPGLVSHLVKKALVDMTNYLEERKKISRDNFDFIQDNAFPELAQSLGVKVIHISEKDTQISHLPKKPDEFANTWSVDGLYTESICASELGWGSHEITIPHFGERYQIGNKNCIFLKRSGKNVLVKSWVPDESFVGMVITHGEAISINDYLSIKNNQGETVYCPTVHYAYCPSDYTILSIQELEHRSLIMQNNVRIMNEDIIDGQDKLGVLIMGNPDISWWTGSLLSIQTARQILANHSPTTLQVAGSMIAAIEWMLKNPQEGIHYPETIPWEPILNAAEKYWGGYHSVATNWHPNNIKLSPFDEPKNEDWVFQNFLVG